MTKAAGRISASTGPNGRVPFILHDASLNVYNDEESLMRVRASDDERVELITRALKGLPLSNLCTTADLVSETFARLHGSEHVTSALARRVARNLIIDLRRRSKTAKKHRGAVEHIAATRSVDKPDEIVAHQESLDRLRYSVDRLSDMRRPVIDAFRNAGEQKSQAARELGVSRGYYHSLFDDVLAALAVDLAHSRGRAS